jgi:hypothetical protein
MACLRGVGMIPPETCSLATARERATRFSIVREFLEAYERSKKQIATNPDEW